MTKLKSNLGYIIFLAVFGLVGGYFTALYSIEILSAELLEQTIAQIGSVDVLILITVLQSLFYSVVLGIIGKILAEKIGLWRPLTIEIKPLFITVIVSIIAGAIFILGDYFVFGSLNDLIKESYNATPTINYIIASITYGGVVEEVMLRLFLMSLVAFLLQKLTKSSEVKPLHLIIANVASVILFAASHLPATIATLGIDALILARCFLLNGGFGLIFGRLYRKYGIQYAMLAHAGLHIVSKLIWIAFI